MRTVSQEGFGGESVGGNAESGVSGRGSEDLVGAVDVGRVMMLVGILVAVGVKLTLVAVLVSRDWILVYFVHVLPSR